MMTLKAMLARFQLACVNYGKFSTDDNYVEMIKWYDMIMQAYVEKQ